MPSVAWKHLLNWINISVVKCLGFRGRGGMNTVREVLDLSLGILGVSPIFTTNLLR